MPILTENIQVLKSAVMADTSDGGGQMTGVAVTDGQSNNLFPDTSAMDRAFGRVAMRKVFGAALTSDTDTLLGAHAILTEAPADPLVHCTLLKTANWADTRTAARDVIERYLVKGPKLTQRIYDTHYTGSLTLRLYTFVVGGTYPAGGDAIVLRNPNGQEQYVRILRMTTKTELVPVFEGGTTVSVQAMVTTCELGQALTMDVLGAPVYRTAGASGLSEANFAAIYTTAVAAGAKLYGVKPLKTAGVVGDLSVNASGIYTNLVPAATIETPIIDQYPLLGRAANAITAIAAVTLPTVANVALTPGKMLTLPTAIEPKSLSVMHGATAFTDTGEYLQQGGTKVADINYRTGVVTFLSSSPNYGGNPLAVAYRPATAVGASAHSMALTVTSANQGLSYVTVVAPSPAPGSLTLGYMAQGRWYALQDNINGKLEGADASYGTGSINYSTGSMAITLGAIPDVASALVLDWGDNGSASKLTTVMPARACAMLGLPFNTAASGLTLAWSNGATNYTASTNAGGVLSGDATGAFKNGFVEFQPGVFPSGPISVSYATAPTQGAQVINSATRTYQASAYAVSAGNPLRKGAVSCDIVVQFQTGAVYPATWMHVYDKDGGLFTRYHPGYGQDATEYLVGTVDYNTGVMQFNDAIPIRQYIKENKVAAGSFGAYAYFKNELKDSSVGISSAYNFAYGYGSTEAQTTTFDAPVWTLSLDTHKAELVLNSMLFSVGDAVYSSASGTLRKGWNASLGSPDVASAGAITTNGLVTLASLPSNRINAVTWYNTAVNDSASDVSSGVFRTSNNPLKLGVMQLKSASLVGAGAENGTISGGGFSGTVDYARGLVRWSGPAIRPETLSYNAVFLEYLPLEASLLGIETARLPLDGKVPIYRSGDLLVVHNTLTTVLPNPLVKGLDYSLGRERIASVRVKDALGAVVPDTLYTAGLNAGTLTVPPGSNITAYSQPFKIEHRIEDMLLCSQVDISGKLKVTRSLTHNFPADTSFVSSAMPFGDLFARAYGVLEQSTWTSVWSDALIGTVITANFNEALYPIVVTNAGAIKERWVLIFTNTTSYRVIGESVGEIGTGNTANACAPLNPATGVPYFTLPALGWGAGWAAGNCLRFNTDACGAPFFVIRTVLQGPASIDSDQFTLAFRGDVDRP